MTELVLEPSKKRRGWYELRVKDKGEVSLPSDTELRRLYLEVAGSKSRLGDLMIARGSQGCELKFPGGLPAWVRPNFLAKVQRVLDSAE
jgi:hypothetical protein